MKRDLKYVKTQAVFKKKTASKPTKIIYIDISKMQSSSPTRNPPDKVFPLKSKTPRKLPQARSLPQLSGRQSLTTRKPQPRREACINSEECGKYEAYIQLVLRELSLCASLPIISMLEIVTRQVTLPRSSFGKTVIFDLDHTLIQTAQETAAVDALLPMTLPTGETTQIGLRVRPYALQCLKELSQAFEIIVFTASQAVYADTILDYLDPHKRLIQHRFYRESCVPVNSVYIKDLRVFLNRRIKDMVIVDNSVLSFANQIENGIPIQTWEGDYQDRELLSLTQYLRKIVDVHDVRDSNRRLFRLTEEPFINLRFFK